MDWTTVKAGDEIGSAVLGHRVWRYRLGPPLVLLSFCLGDSRIWPTDTPYESDKEPNEDCAEMAHGIYAYKTLSELRNYFRDLPGLLSCRDNYAEGRADPAYYDGVVRGTVLLWGRNLDGPRGYRARYAYPFSFDEAYGERADEAIDRLRRMFNLAYGETDVV